MPASRGWRAACRGRTERPCRSSDRGAGPRVEPAGRAIDFPHRSSQAAAGSLPNIGCRKPMSRIHALLLAVLTFPLAAQQTPPPPLPDKPDAAPSGEAAEPAAPVRTAIGNFATVALPEGWRYLPGKKGQDFLTGFGNPPNPNVVGVAVHAEHQFFVVYFYNDEGHVKDDDVANLDFDAMLRDMQAGAREGNKERERQKLATVELRGWAERPHYDAADKKLYYAERLKFSDGEGETLNYFVRVLGRSGVLEMNAVGDMGQLAQIAQGSKELLAATQFVAGKTYQDFDPAYDKIAAYGIGGLIAGKLLLKVGLLAGLLKFLGVLWKPIAIGVVAVGSVFARMLGKRKAAPPTPTQA